MRISSCTLTLLVGACTEMPGGMRGLANSATAGAAAGCVASWLRSSLTVSGTVRSRDGEGSSGSNTSGLAARSG